MYAEFEVHRTMICDRVRTEAFRRAIDSVVRPGDIVLDVGAGSGILSVFAARAGAARVYAVERTSVAVLAQELAAANGAADIVQVIHGDVMDVELPERVDVIVSEWLGGFGIDEGMLVPVIVARGPLRCQARAGKSTTSRRSGRRSTTEHSPEREESRRRKRVVDGADPFNG